MGITCDNHLLKFNFTLPFEHNTVLISFCFSLKIHCGPSIHLCIVHEQRSSLKKPKQPRYLMVNICKLDFFCILHFLQHWLKYGLWEFCMKMFTLPVIYRYAIIFFWQLKNYSFSKKFVTFLKPFHLKQMDFWI